MEGGDEDGGDGAAEEAQVAGTNQLAMASSKPALKKAPTAALYQKENTASAPTRVGGAHVSYAAGYAAGLGAA